MAARSPLQKFLGLHEIFTLGFFKCLLSEFLGTAMLIVMGCGGVCTMAEGGTLPQVVPALVFGMTVATIVWTLNHRSGAHINPAVSLAFLVVNKLTLSKFIAFSITQCLGAIAGSYVLWFILPEGWRGNVASTLIHQDVSLWQAFSIEVLATFFLLLCVMSSGDMLRTDHLGSMPLTIGLCVFVQSSWAGTLTGCSMNPARTLGPALVSGAWDTHWLYWTAPCLGSVLGALLYTHVLAEDTRAVVHMTYTQEPPDLRPKEPSAGQTQDDHQIGHVNLEVIHDGGHTD